MTSAGAKTLRQTRLSPAAPEQNCYLIVKENVKNFHVEKFKRGGLRLFHSRSQRVSYIEIFSPKKCLPKKTLKKRASKVAHNRPQIFFHSTGPAARTSSEFIFHIIIMSQDLFVTLSVVYYVYSRL